ncbi:MAG: metal/formaldehyde-sensitive transcriptional repressor [Polaromonas sp.]|uniref:metal/formaldehyde-sensitive transcriptional repressor n=1 Tax=Polaromonas sp. TaxID=1869339 RepID=UPI0025DA634A|nr:metal/formaldehyde-sensitive transcriptional repressor [Polaromonas sp.]MBI2728487.1 metal/formaldehyde-sensitive transcriptional repressor [Polaromonas sp.]
MAHTLKNKKSLLTRIRRIKGQATALEGALDSEAGCSEILQQIAAIRGAVNGLMMEVLDGHLREHLGTEALSAVQREKDIDQVVSIFRSYMK